MTQIQIQEGDAAVIVLDFEAIICCNCKIPFLVTASHRAKLVQTNEIFYCPNGHQQHYTRKAEECPTKLQQAQKEASLAWQRHDEAVREAMELKYKIKDLRKTECPYCGDRRINMTAHLKRYHPNEI